MDEGLCSFETWHYPSNCAIGQHQLDIALQALSSNLLIVAPAGLDLSLALHLVMYNINRWFPASKCVLVVDEDEAAEESRRAFVSSLGCDSNTALLSSAQHPSSRQSIWRSDRVGFVFSSFHSFAKDVLNGSCRPDTLCLVIFRSVDSIVGTALGSSVLDSLKSTGPRRIVACSGLSLISRPHVQDMVASFGIQKVELCTLASPAFNHILEVVTVPSNEALRGFLDRFNADILKPQVCRLESANPTIRLPPIERITCQVVHRLQESLGLANSHPGGKDVLTTIAALVKLRESVQSSSFQALCTSGLVPSSALDVCGLHPKVEQCIKIIAETGSVPKRVLIVTPSTHIASEIRHAVSAQMPALSIGLSIDGCLDVDVSIVHQDTCAHLAIGNHTTIFFDHSTFSSFSGVRERSLVLGGHKVFLLLSPGPEALLHAKWLEELDRLYKQSLAVDYPQVPNSLALRAPPRGVQRFFDIPEAVCAPAKADLSPSLSFITMQMILEAPYPALARHGFSETLVSRIPHSERSLFLSAFVSCSPDASTPALCTPDYIAKWIDCHAMFIDVNHFHVPDDCFDAFLSCVDPTSRGASAEHHKCPEPAAAATINSSGGLAAGGRWRRSGVVESSDQLSSPVHKRPKPGTYNVNRVSKFIDYEAGVSGSDDDGEDSEADPSLPTSMRDFIDDRSEVEAWMSSQGAARSLATSQSRGESMMAFYRQSLDSSQPLGFDQPARQFCRKLKVKLPDIKSVDERSSVAGLQEAVQDIDWSDDLLV